MVKSCRKVARNWQKMHFLNKSMQNVSDINESFPCIHQISYGTLPYLAVATIIGKLGFIRTPTKVSVVITDRWLCDLTF